VSPVLAFDSCFDSCSVALFDGGGIVASAFEPMQRGQAERLPTMAAEVLAAAGEGARIDRVAVTTGPGTFTGVRIGLSFARAFALARGVPCIGISSLEVVALTEGTDGVRVAIFPAAQGVYGAAYKNGAVLIAPSLLKFEDFVAQLPEGPVTIAGAASAELAAALGERAFASKRTLPDARDLARLAIGRPPGDHPPQPLYLRAPDIRPSKRALRASGGAA
jgi:tRNA threonylcarbamoyladenosine biosynthesis protein TsaB